MTSYTLSFDLNVQISKLENQAKEILKYSKGNIEEIEKNLRMAFLKTRRDQYAQVINFLQQLIESKSIDKQICKKTTIRRPLSSLKALKK